MSNDSGHDKNSQSEIVCNACGFEASFVPEGMMPCERCKAAYYCSLECLQWDWKSGGHSKVCVPIVTEDDYSNSNSTVTEDRSLNNTEFSESSLSINFGADVHHVFDGSSTCNVSAGSSQQFGGSGGGTGGPTPTFSNVNSNAERLRQWGEQMKNASPCSLTSTSLSSLNDSDSTNDENRGGMQLHTFLYHQKKLAKRAALPPALPVPIEEEDDDEAEEIEEIEEIIEEEEFDTDMSIDLMNASYMDNLNSIVEESEATGDEPDIEGSWRSRDPFLFPRSSHTAHTNEVEDDYIEETVHETVHDAAHSSADEFSEEESFVEESYESVEGSASSYDAMAVEEDDVTRAIRELGTPYYQSMRNEEQDPSEGSFHSEGSSPGQAVTVKGSVSSAINKRGFRKYSSAPMLEDIDESGVSEVTRGSLNLDGVHMDDIDNSGGGYSEGSSGVADELMNQYGYNSDDDGDFSGSSSLGAETGEETSRTEDTAQLAAQPGYDPHSSKAKLIHEESSNEEEEDDPLMGALSQSTAGQMSREAATTGTSTGQQSKEERSTKTMSITAFFEKHSNDRGVTRPLVVSNANAPQRPGAESTTLLTNQQSSSLNRPTGRDSSVVSSSLLDFRSVYSSAPTNVTASNNSHTLKDFRKVYQSPSLSTSSMEASLRSGPNTSDPTNTLPTSAEPVGDKKPISSRLPLRTPDSTNGAQANHPSCLAETNPKTIIPNSVEAPLQNGAFARPVHNPAKFKKGTSNIMILKHTREEESQAPFDEHISVQRKDYGTLMEVNASRPILVEPIIVATALLQEGNINYSSSRESNPNTPPATSNVLPTNNPQSTGMQSSNTSPLPRYLAYRSHLTSRGGYSPETRSAAEVNIGSNQNVSGRATTVVSNTSPRIESPGENGSKMRLDAEAAQSHLPRQQELVTAPQSTEVQRQHELHLQPNEGQRQDSGRTGSGEYGIEVDGQRGGSLDRRGSADEAAASPAVGAQEDFTLSSAATRLTVPSGTQDRAQPVGIVESATQSSTSTSATFATPSAMSNSNSRYQSYRSHLARASGPTARKAVATVTTAFVATDANDISSPSTGIEGISAQIPLSDEHSVEPETATTGSSFDFETNSARVTPDNDGLHQSSPSYSLGVMSTSSLSAVSEPVPRYLSYRQNIARRINASSSSSKPTGTQEITRDGAISDDDVDEVDVEERLTSYLHKSMVGATVTTAAVAATVGATAEESQTSLTESANEGISEELALEDSQSLPVDSDAHPPLSTSVSRAEAAPGEQFSSAPLRSRRAADALARAQKSRLESEKSRMQSLRDTSDINGTNNGGIGVGVSRASADPLLPITQVAACVPYEPAASSGTNDLEAGMPSQTIKNDNEPPPLQVETTEMKDGAPRSRRVLLVVILVLLLVVCPLAIGLGVGLSRRNNGAVTAASTPTLSNMTSPPTLAPDAVPVPTIAPDNREPSTSPTLEESQKEIPSNFPTKTTSPSAVNTLVIELLDLLSGVSFDGGDSIQVAGTPQNQAFTWLSESTDLDVLSDERKIQRYALATLYFSSGGESWGSSDGWLSEDDECNWFSRSSSVCDSLGYATDLSLGSNGLEGPLPPEIALLSRLTAIALGDNSLDGTVPEDFASLSLLTFFSVHNNKLEGELSNVFDGWPLLEFLDVSVNKFTGSFPQEITRQTGLRQLDVSENLFSGTLPDFSPLSDLERLSLNGNDFSGSLAGWTGQLSNLQYLAVQSNSLTALHNSVGLLTALEVFEAYDNNISGDFFTVLGGLTKLRVLDLHMNDISGPIPQDIGLLENLRYLDLSSNKLDGEIPRELGQLVNLTDLLLNSNELSGELPTELDALRRLTTIRIDDNNLVGTVPTEVCDLFSDTLPTFFLDCGGLDPEIACPPGLCCTYCCENDPATDTSVCQCLFEGTGFDFLC